MKIPFSIKYRPQIESGEYKVETRDGRKARIIDWDLNCSSPIVAAMDAHIDLPGEIVDVFSVSGRAFDDLESPSDLFIVTPEPELSEFKEKVKQLIGHYPVATRENKGSLLYEVRKAAAELLSLAIDARAGELSEGLEQSKIDKDSIPYHLIEFMCNLYDCQNWKEIDGLAELYVTRIKAAALKDLPRWGPSTGCFDEGWLNAGILYYKFHAIPLKTLEKLPGFKED